MSLENQIAYVWVGEGPIGHQKAREILALISAHLATDEVIIKAVQTSNRGATQYLGMKAALAAALGEG